MHQCLRLGDKVTRVDHDVCSFRRQLYTQIVFFWQYSMRMEHRSDTMIITFEQYSMEYCFRR